MGVGFVLVDDLHPSDNEFSKEIGHEEHLMESRRCMIAESVIQVEQTDSAILPLGHFESGRKVGR